MDPYTTYNAVNLQKDGALVALMDRLIKKENHEATWTWLSKTASKAMNNTSLDIRYIAQLELIFQCLRTWSTSDWTQHWPRLCAWGREHRENAITDSRDRRGIRHFLEDYPITNEHDGYCIRTIRICLCAILQEKDLLQWDHYGYSITNVFDQNSLFFIYDDMYTDPLQLSFREWNDWVRQQEAEGQRVEKEQVEAEAELRRIMYH